MKSVRPYKFRTVAIAGTFDRLHKGHRFFISEAFKLGEKVIIGLTSDEYARKKLRTKNIELRGGGIRIKVNNYQTRKRELGNYLKREGLLRLAEIVKIDDIYGPAIERNQIEALAVTAETLEGAEKVNSKRKEVGISPLKILKIPLIPADDGKRIASTRIRLGEIDRWGRAFSKIFNFQFSIFKITDGLRQELKKPLGKLIRGNPNDLKMAAERLINAVTTTKPVLISTIGDEVTRICNEIGITIHLAVIDYKVAREKKYHSLAELGFVHSKELKTPRRWPRLNRGSPPMVEGSVIKVNNPPGHITKELVSAVKNAYFRIIKDNKQRIIKVDGEEDLAGVPAILLAPLESIVLYGQPGQGVVLVKTTEEKKEQLAKLISLY